MRVTKKHAPKSRKLSTMQYTRERKKGVLVLEQVPSERG